MTKKNFAEIEIRNTFQYRKRYEVTCDRISGYHNMSFFTSFQYRKRYEVTCDEFQRKNPSYFL